MIGPDGGLIVSGPKGTYSLDATASTNMPSSCVLLSLSLNSF
jgi:hypothetical protein